MAAQGQKSFGARSLIAGLRMSAVAVTLLPGTVRADDCIAAPNSAAPEGSRWYYRLDRATQRKCWYVRALGQPAQQAAAPDKMAPSEPSYAIPVPRPRPSAAGSASSLRPGDTDPSSSHTEGIAAKPNATPPVGGPTDETTSSSAAPAPSATPLNGATKDETTSAISDLHQAATSPDTSAAGTTPAPYAERLIGATTDETSSPTSDIAAPQQAATSSEPNAQAAFAPSAAPLIITTINDTASSIPKEFATQPSTPSEIRSNTAELAPRVSVAEPNAPLALATVNARPIPTDARADLVSDHSKATAREGEPIDNAGMPMKPFLLILVFVLALVGLLYYVVLKYLPGGSARIGADHPEDDRIDDDQYSNPEFYRKLRQGVEGPLDSRSGSSVPVN